jgi:hypothetical protein
MRFYILTPQVFSLRAKHQHGDIQAWRDLQTGQVSITKVHLHRDASAHAMAHEVGHVIDYALQNANASGGSLDAGFLIHTETLRKLADYTCAHHETSSPDYVRRLQARPATPTRQRNLRYLARYYETYVYQPEELLARLVAVSFTEPYKARAIAPAAYAWLQATLDQDVSVRSALAEVGLWPGLNADHNNVCDGECRLLNMIFHRGHLHFGPRAPGVGNRSRHHLLCGVHPPRGGRVDHDATGGFVNLLRALPGGGIMSRSPTRI